ncbi:MAG: carbon storage regulator [Fuerstiella sp.]
MLKLTRRKGEGIAINEETFIWIVKTSRGRCEIAIEAPRSQHVRRCELPMETEQLLQRTAAGMGVPS